MRNLTTEEIEDAFDRTEKKATLKERNRIKRIIKKMSYVTDYETKLIEPAELLKSI